MLDITHPQARAWALSKMKAAIALGADGWMADFAEWLPTDSVLYGGSGRVLHNRYPVLWQELSREAIDSPSDGEPRMFFARSGWFGTPAVADCIWAGDQRTDMQRDDGMPTLIPIGIGLGLVGVSTYGHDIAGYNSTVNAPSTKEVFFRWTELGAWTPVMRTHHGNAPDKNWSWTKDAETTALFKRYAQLHMSLVPWWEGLALTASETGMPIWRGMAIHFPDDETVWPIDDQVMVGDGVLVAPIQKPGETSRKVYLPKGLWYSWEGTEVIGGPMLATASAPLEEIPVYVRGGTIIPMLPETVMTVFHGSASVPGPAQAGDARVVRAFLGGDGEFLEASGLRYVVEQLEPTWYGELTFRWQGSALAICAATPQVPCVQSDAHVATLHLAGPGIVDVTQGSVQVARLQLQGGDPQAAKVLSIRH
jgi:alpha-glucosidase